MSEITPDVVRHLAHLARIALTDDEVARLTSELSVIVDAVAVVRSAGADVPATSHPIALGTVTRPDVVGETLTQQQALAGAPETEDGRFKVSAILGEEQ